MNLSYNFKEMRAFTNLQCLELRQGEILEGHGDILGPATAFRHCGNQFKVVVDHGDEVLGDLDVELDNVRPGRDRILERGNRVLPNVGAASKHSFELGILQ